MVDYNFFYKYSIRSIVIAKYVKINNSFEVPFISKLVYFFIISHIEDLDDVQIYNYSYLFKYFFGKNVFLTRIKSFFRLGIWSYSFQVSMICVGKDVLINFLHLIMDFVLKADQTFIKSGIFNKRLNIFYIVIKDLNVFSEKKTNLGLFYLYRDLNVHFFCKGGDYFSVTYLLNNLKVQICESENGSVGR